jgi:hypothetical protein
MVERSRHDSTRDLLEELEDGWATPAMPPARVHADAGAQARGDVRAPAPSNPDLDALDEGWLDDLFPGEEADDDDDDDDDEPEPELPDERLDPEAFALAKKAREERAAKKKEKKRAKAEAKRARQKARAAAMRQKQKAKKGRPATPPRRDPRAAAKDTREQARSSDRNVADESVADAPQQGDETDEVAGLPASATRAKSSAVARSAQPSTLASVKLLAIVLAILLALAGAVAAIVK